LRCLVVKKRARTAGQPLHSGQGGGPTLVVKPSGG
jgi:hypothetical protein